MDDVKGVLMAVGGVFAVIGFMGILELSHISRELMKMRQNLDVYVERKNGK